MQRPLGWSPMTSLLLGVFCFSLLVGTAFSYRTVVHAIADIISADTDNASTNAASETSAMGAGCCESAYAPEINTIKRVGSCDGRRLFHWRENPSCVGEDDLEAEGLVKSMFWDEFMLGTPQLPEKKYLRCNYYHKHTEESHEEGSDCGVDWCRGNPMPSACNCERWTSTSCQAHWTIVEYPREKTPPQALPSRYSRDFSIKAKFVTWCKDVVPKAREEDPEKNWWWHYTYETYTSNGYNTKNSTLPGIPRSCSNP